MKRYYVHILAVLFGCMLTGCAKNAGDLPGGADWLSGNLPRLIVSGCVTDEAAQPLQGIRIDIYGVREETEPDILSYNYALTDSAGMYIICRYLGREVPAEVTIVATDPQDQYSEQTLFEAPSEPTQEFITSGSPTFTIHANFSLTLK